MRFVRAYRRYRERMDPAAEPILPHSYFGAPSCCGCLFGVVRGDEAQVVCNECEAVVRSVPVADLARTIAEMEFTLDFATSRCPHCGAEHLRPGLGELLSFTCTHRGRGVDLTEAQTS